MPRSRLNTRKLRCTDSASQMHPGCTFSTASRAFFQNSTGTSEATSHREAVHDARPIAQMLYLRVPERGAGIVQIDNVRPVGGLVAEASVRLPVIKLRVLGDVHRVRRRVVVHHIDDALHAARVDRVHERLEIFKRAVLGIDRAVIAVRVGTAETALFALLADGVDGHEPDDIRSQRADAVKIGDHGAERPLRRMVAHIHAVNDLLAQRRTCILCHSDFSFAKHAGPGADRHRDGNFFICFPQPSPPRR